MENKQNQRIALTKRLLKESLIQLMEEKNIQKISISELCHLAGINRTTFYNHYGSQYDLLREMELDMIADLEAIETKEKQKPDLTINKRIELLCSYLYEHRRFSKLLFRNVDINSEFSELIIHSAHVQSIYQEMLSDIEDLENKKMIMTFFSNGIYSMIRQWLFEDIEKTPKEMGELVYDITIRSW